MMTMCDLCGDEHHPHKGPTEEDCAYCGDPADARAHQGDECPPLADQIEHAATCAVTALVRDAEGRRGMWPDDLRPETEAEIRATWRDLIAAEMREVLALRKELALRDQREENAREAAIARGKR